jgi:hypothetical protein
MRFLTAYHVDGGRIRDLWHLAWRPPAVPTDPDATEVIRRLHAARAAGDEKSRAARFAPGARHFCPSGRLRTLPDRPCPATVDASAARIDVTALFAVGELVVEQATISGVDRRDQLTIYRVRNGLITDVWHPAP